MLQARGLSNEISEKLKSFCMLKYPNMRCYDEEGVMEDLPKSLQRSIKIELFSDVIKRWYLLLLKPKQPKYFLHCLNLYRMHDWYRMHECVPYALHLHV